MAANQEPVGDHPRDPGNAAADDRSAVNLVQVVDWLGGKVNEPDALPLRKSEEILPIWNPAAIHAASGLLGRIEQQRVGQVVVIAAGRRRLAHKHHIYTVRWVGATAIDDYTTIRHELPLPPGS